jgi:acyl-CoA dehydrogenase
LRGVKVDFEIPEECLMIKNKMKDFVKKELELIANDIDENNKIPEKVVQKMKELGFFGMTIPKKYGGEGLSLLAYCFAIFELAKVGLAYRSLIAINNGLVPRSILLGGSEDQKKRYLPPIAKGEKIAAFAITEPEAGSDVAGIRTTAVRKGERFVLNGTKHFITNGPIADIVLVVAINEESPRPEKRITALLVEKGTPGFSVGATYETMGLRGEPIGELVFRDCYVPTENVLGEVGRGFSLIMKSLSEGRATISAGSIGAAEKLLELSIDYLKPKRQLDKAISELGAIQSMLAEMATEIYATKMMLYHTIWKIERGEIATKEASMLKFYSSEMVNRLANMAVRIYGYFGYFFDRHIDRLFRDVRCLKIVEGTSEIQKLIIARQLLKN